MTDHRDIETGYLVAEVEFCLDEFAQLDVAVWNTGIRPQHRIAGRPYTFIGQLDFIGRNTLGPGECCRAKASCIIAEQDRPYFVAGFCWHVCKMDRIVGYARYVSAFNG